MMNSFFLWYPRMFMSEGDMKKPPPYFVFCLGESTSAGSGPCMY